MYSLILAVILLFPSFGYAGWFQDQETAIAAINGATPPGCSRGSSFVVENFTDIANDEEWSNDGNWTENTASTNIYIGDTDQAVHSGGNSGLVADAAASSSIERIHAAQGNTGYITYETWFRVADTSSYGADIIISDGSTTYATNYRTRIQFANGSVLIRTTSGTEDTLFDYAANTDYKIEIQINLAASGAGNQAITLWIGDGTTQTQYGPYDTYADQNPGSGIDRFAVYRASTANSVQWFDFINGYAGERCAE